MMFSHDSLGDSMFEFAKLLMLISFGYAFITFYEAPLPGIGVSFSNLITDQTGYFQSVLEARAFDNIYRHFDDLSEHFMQPDAWSILANLIYWTMLLLIALAKALSLAVVAFGLIASAVCGLLGPDLRPVLHRAEAGVAVLGLAEGVHPVLVRPRRRHRVPDDLRAVRLPLRDDAAADDHVGGVRVYGLQAVAVVVDVLPRNRACPLVDELDLLGAGRAEHRFVCAALDPHALKEDAYATPIPDTDSRPSARAPRGQCAGPLERLHPGHRHRHLLGPRRRRPVDCLAAAGRPRR